jgi:hypothetical protein
VTESSVNTTDPKASDGLPPADFCVTFKRFLLLILCTAVHLKPSDSTAQESNPDGAIIDSCLTAVSFPARGCLLTISSSRGCNAVFAAGQ